LATAWSQLSASANEANGVVGDEGAEWLGAFVAE